MPPHLSRLLAAADVQQARQHLERTDERTLDEQVALTRIAAPPFGEGPRGAAMAELMRAAELEVLETDGAGNVISRFSDSAPWTPQGRGALPLVVAAHLDTVFPAGTDTEVTRDGDLLKGPGISDDGRGLAATLALARAARAGALRFEAPLLVIATVGEEGTGDLRGVRHLFSPQGALAQGCRAFVSLDGAGLRRIINTGLGSLRYRATVRGPGGHSWVDYGVPNPIHALARAMEGCCRIPLSTAPTTTFSIGRWGGGTSVNAIPTEAWVEFEVRSETEVELSRMDLEIRSVLDQIAGLEVELAPLGRRPAGRTATEHALARAAAAATEALGVTPEFGVSSTDANLPMSLGIPSLTLGAGGDAGQAHTPDEWYRNARGPDGIFRALLTLLLADRAMRSASDPRLPPASGIPSATRGV